MAAEELTMLCGNAALLSLSGAHTPHHRAGQLETLVVISNKDNIKCMYELPAPPPPLVVPWRDGRPAPQQSRCTTAAHAALLGPQHWH
jgi:hypothetical protein